MPRRTVLSSSEREGLFALPDNQKDLIQQYTFSESDLSIIRQHRGAANHMGFAIQLCYMRYPGIILSINEKPFPPLLNVVADQLKMTTDVWDEYGKRDQTRREHLAELQTIFGFQTFSMESYQSFVNSLADLAWQTDKGIVLASALVQSFRSQRILLPSINVIERICAEAITNASRRIYFSLTEHLTKEHLQRLNALLVLKEDSKFTTLAWLRESPGAAKARHIQEHIERLKAIRNLDLPVALDKMIHQNRLLKLAREGRQMTAHDLSKFEPNRRYATIIALIIEAHATIIDEIVEIIKAMNANQSRKIPKEAPTGFVRKRWKKFVFSDDGLDRCFYELCVLSELKNALRSGDIWVQGSRQFKDFEEYLLPTEKFALLKEAKESPIAVTNDCSQYLQDRLLLLEEQLETVNRLAKTNELPDAIFTASGLKITPLTNSVPIEAEALTQQVYSLLPRVKITELLIEVDGWIGFTKHFRHIKNNETANDKHLLLTAILADAINLGLRKMTDSCPGTTYAKLSWLQAWHIRDETYSAALAELTNSQFYHPFALIWGEGTTSSSDGQRFKTAGHSGDRGNINPKYGSDPGVQFYTHISDQYAPFHTKVINVGVRDATYVLDGLLYHESDIRIEEHYTDTSGFTDHVFALMHLLGFRFAPRIRDLADKRLFIVDSKKEYASINCMIGDAINVKHIKSHWDEILRLAASIKQGTVTASLILRKLGSYPRQNGLAMALRELGRVERTLFTLDWLQNVELRRRVNAGLNKGEAKNTLARAVFFNRLGEMRDRSFENQRYRASGLNLVIAAIVLWNTVYLERIIQHLKDTGQTVNENLLKHLSPLGWEHINLTGDYVWRQSKVMEKGEFRSLQRLQNP